MRASEKRNPQPSSWRQNIWKDHLWGPNRLYYMLGIILVLALGVYAYIQLSVKPATPSQNAWTACSMFVTRQIGISATAAQPYNLADVKALGDNTYQVDLNYEKIGIAYTCATMNLPDGTWQLVSLKVK